MQCGKQTLHAARILACVTPRATCVTGPVCSAHLGVHDPMRSAHRGVHDPAHSICLGVRDPLCITHRGVRDPACSAHLGAQPCCSPALHCASQQCHPAAPPRFAAGRVGAAAGGKPRRGWTTWRRTKRPRGASVEAWPAAQAPRGCPGSPLRMLRLPGSGAPALLHRLQTQTGAPQQSGSWC